MSGLVSPGDIVHLYFRSITPQKHKLAVVACLSPRPGFFLINSRIPGYVTRRPELVAANVKIHSSEHRCLTHDSFINTAEMFGEYTSDDLNTALQSASAVRRESISARCQDRMLRAIRESRLLPQVKKDWVYAAFQVGSDEPEESATR